MTASDPELQRLIDEAAIRRCLETYCRGIDRGDAELVKSAYHPDATDDHGRFKGRGWDFAELAVRVLNERYEATMHVLGNSVVELDGDRAAAETQVLAFHKSAGTLERFGGRYVDRLERRDGEWRLADRVVVHEWSSVDPIAEFPSAGEFAHGERSPADFSYRALGATPTR